MSEQFELTAADGTKVFGKRLPGGKLWLVTTRYRKTVKTERYTTLQLKELLTGMKKDSSYISMVIEGKETQ